MFCCGHLNSVFLTCDDEPKKYRSTLINGPRPYNPKVKIHGWEERFLSQPHDNNVKGLKESTYKRIGTEESPTGVSVTRAMTEQIRSKADYDPDYRHRCLLNIYSFPYTQTEEYKKSSETLCRLKDFKSAEPTDYRTSLRDDFPWHYAEKALPPLAPHDAPPTPWLLYRRTLGYSDHDLERRPGVQTFLDDDFSIQSRVAALKMPVKMQ